MYAAKVLADSMAPNGVRLVTMEVTFPRFILAEFNTHRMFSRNSASSRAIPLERRIAQVRANPFVPEAFGANKSGMQAGADLGGWKAVVARWLWLLAAKFCVLIAWGMSHLGIHKQHANRVIELWAWHTVVVSATEWENFFRLRTHKDAQPEMQIVAKMMRDAHTSSVSLLLKEGDWHLPYVTSDERSSLSESQEVALSVVKCAAVSFERQNTERTREAVTARHDAMIKSAHWSPFEHVAQVGSERDVDKLGLFKMGEDDFIPEFIGNFRAPWVQYRKRFPNEEVWEHLEYVPGASV